MAPKSKSREKKEKKEKKNKSAEGPSSIAPALIPNAALSIVPRTPPPTLQGDLRDSYDLDISTDTGVLRASAMGRLYTTQSPDDILSEDTDTSLFDYEQARGTMSATGASGSLRRSMGERPMAPPPPPGFNDDTDDDPPDYDPMYSEVRVEREIVPVYATPVRRDPGRSGSFRADSDEDSAPPNSSMRRFQRDDANQLRDSRGSRGSRGGSLRNSMVMEERVESMMMNSQASSRSQSMERSAREASLAQSTNRLATLSAESRRLAGQHAETEARAEADATREKETLAKLAASNPGSMDPAEISQLLHETQSVASASLRSQGEAMRTVNRRVEVLENEKRELQELNHQLQGEVNTMHRKASFRENEDDLVHSQAAVMKKQLQDLKDDSTTLKSTIHRLNGELSRYQAQFTSLSDKEKNDLPGLPLKGPKPSWLLNTKYLAPLFVAYDDRLAKKDEVLKQYERNIDSLASRVEEVIQENQRLHLRLDQADPLTGTGPRSMTEWRQLQEQCKLVLEENQLLMEQLDIQHGKQRDMHHAHMLEVKRLSQKVVEAESHKSTVEREVELVRREYTVMKEKHEVVVENNTKLTANKTPEQLARELEAEQIQHQQSIANLQNKIETLSCDKKSLQIQVDDLKTEHKTMNGELKALYKKERQSHRKIILLQKALEESESKEHTAEHYLSTVIKMAEKTEIERDTYAHAAHKQTRQKKKVINRLLEENNTVTRMEDKLKLYKHKLIQKLERAADRLKEQDDAFNSQRREYEREIKHLRLLLREKDDQIHTASGERKRVEEDLEVMWQTASKDNREMRDTLKKTIRRLKTHEAFVDDDDLDDQEKLLIDPADRIYDTKPSSEKY